jgi:hypothetical protein
VLTSITRLVLRWYVQAQTLTVLSTMLGFSVQRQP